MTKNEVKDGVTLIADAIRKEIEIENAKQTVTASNVADATAQFSNKKAPADNKSADVSNKADTSDNTDNTDNAPDGTPFTDNGNNNE